MEITQTKIAGVLVLTPRRFSDDRGWFSETCNDQTLAAAGLSLTFVQDNHSYSKDANTLRGLHYQTAPHAQDKLVRVLRGSILDVAVDLRTGSPSFGHHVVVELSAENGKQLLIPKGFLHGFITCEPHTEVAYKCTDFYAPACDGAVRFDDPDLGINWGCAAQDIILSDKDAAAPSFRQTVPQLCSSVAA